MSNNKKVDLSGYLLSSTAESTYAKLSAIPNMNNYYTKTETDSKLSTKANTSSISDMSNYYTKTDVDDIISDTRVEAKYGYGSMLLAFDNNKVGDVGILNDGTYYIKWVIYTISGNTYQLFPMQNLASFMINYMADNYIQGTILPNLKKSGLNITSCDLVSDRVYEDICAKTGKTSKEIANGEKFWLMNPYSSGYYAIDSNGSISNYAEAYGNSFGARPLITVVK